MTDESRAKTDYLPEMPENLIRPGCETAFIDWFLATRQREYRNFETLQQTLNENSRRFQQTVQSLSAMLEGERTKRLQAEELLRRTLEELEAGKRAQAEERKRFQEICSGLESAFSKEQECRDILHTTFKDTTPRSGEKASAAPEAEREIRRLATKLAWANERLEGLQAELRRKQESERMAFDEISALKSDALFKESNWKAKLQAMQESAQREIEKLRTDLRLAESEADQKIRAGKRELETLSREFEQVLAETETERNQHAEEVRALQRQLQESGLEKAGIRQELQSAQAEIASLRSHLARERTRSRELESLGLQNLITERDQLLRRIQEEASRIPRNHPVHRQLSELVELQKKHTERLETMLSGKSPIIPPAPEPEADPTPPVRDYRSPSIDQ